MRSASQEETLAAKQAYEHLAATHEVTIRRYHANNGRFAEKAFRAAVDDVNQSISYCGEGAHHQNGIAENHIKQLILTSRTLLPHAKPFWSEAITTILWPFALKTAAERHNRLKIDINSVTPNKKFSGIRTEMNLKDEHPWGCPIYVPGHHLQDVSGGMPKWEPRSRLGIYLGHSPFHASSVALVLNPRTGHVSPQYYVAIDNDFSTVPHMRAVRVPKNWADLVKRSSECVTE